MKDDNLDNFIYNYNAFLVEDLFLSNQTPNEPINNNKKMYICNITPHDIPTFDILYDNKSHPFKLKLSCLCKRNEEYSFEDAFHNLIEEFKSNKNYDNYHKCNFTGHKTNQFKYYCKKCKRNLCNLCFTKFKICPHGQEDLFLFNKKYNDYLQKGELILNQLNAFNHIDPYIEKLFKGIYDNFKEYKNNYSYFDIINKYEELISKINNL